MRFHNKTFLILALTSLSVVAFAQTNDDELNSEINNLQVQLKPVDTPPATTKKKIKTNSAAIIKPASPTAPKSTQVVAPVWHRQKRVADNSISVLPPGPPPAPADAPRALDKRAPVAPVAVDNDTPYVPESYITGPATAAPAYNSAYDDNAPAVSTQTKKTGVLGFVENLFDSVAIMPMLTTSSLDGSAQSQVVPSGVTSPVAFNAAGEIHLDLNLGVRNLLLEVGGTYLRTGAQTGYSPYAGFNNFIYQDQVTLGYAAVPITAKYIFGHQDKHGGLYVRAGIEPAYLLSHSYYSYSGVSEELRFGGYSQWDFMLTAGAGYAYNVTDHFQLFLDVAGYQGMIPVFQTMNAYNLGFSTGLGLAYRL